MPQSGSLHTLLYNIINQRFAIPENSNDRVALTALGLLCSGTETYTSVMSFLLEEYSYLANFYYQQNDLEKYNHYFSLISTTFSDFKNSLAGNNGLINEVINVLNEVKSYDFIKDEREDVVEFASKRIDSLNSVKSKLVTINNLSQEKSTEKIKYNFSNSQVKTPIGHWEDRRKVSYAIQIQSNGTNYQVGEWSTPARVYKKANPLLDIGTDPGGRTRLIFRKFDNDKPELVGIVEDSDQKEFRDINRDLYNAVLELNEDMAIDEMEVFLVNGADINARYERGRQAIHAAAENGNSNIMLTLKNRGANINARDTNGYAPIHVAAGVGYENFIKDLVANGADVNAKTSLGRTALHVAAEKGHVNSVANLMQIEGIDINAKDQRGFTPLHTAASFGKNNVITSLSQDNRTDINAQSEVGFTPLHLAAIGEYSDAVEALLASDKIDINAKTQSGLTVLHFASLIGNSNIAKLIIGHNKANINEKSTDGWTPLHLAINSKQESVALELLSIDNIEINTKGKDDLTPLHLAASSGQKSIVSKLLDKGASIEDIDKYGYTPLHFAIESGDLDMVKCLVEKGANLYAERKDGYTPLGLAAYNGESDIVKFLVNNKGVNVNAENKNGMTPIDFVASNGYFNIVEFLIDKGANKESALHWAAYGGHLNIVRYLADEKHFDSNKKDKYGNIPVHSAALQGHLNVVKYFVGEKQVDLNTENNNGYTPFLFAVLGGNLDIIRYFIDEKNVDLNSSPNKSDNNGSTALHLATLNSNLGVIKYLIRKGANVSAIDNYGNTPLFPATSRGHLDMVKYLIQKGANFEVTNNYNNTLLHFASWNGHLDIVKYFVEKEADLNAANKDGNTPLHVSASVDITRYLTEKGADLRAVSKDGYTPLHVAAANGNLDIIKYLLEQGVNIHARVTQGNEESNNGKTALHLAAQNGRLDVLEHLVKEGADVNSRDDSGKTPRDLANQNGHTNIVEFLEEVQLNLNLLNAVKQGNLGKVKEYVSQGASLKVQDKNGNTIQEIAIKSGNIKITKFLEQAELDLNLVNAVKQGNLDLVKKYIAEGASLEAKDKNGNSLLYLAAQNNDIVLFLKQAPQLNLGIINAAEKGNLDVVKEYINRGASTNAKNRNDETPLHKAAYLGKLEIVKYLIEKGADFNATNNYGHTPLYKAAYWGRLETVKYLIEKGADFNAKDNDGVTILHVAAQEGHLDVVKYLVEKGANINAKSNSGVAVLDKADSLDIVKYLIEKEADLSAGSKNGLLYIAAGKSLDFVQYLVEKGADFNAASKDRNTPLHKAAHLGKLGIVKYLIEKGADFNATNNYGHTPLYKAAYWGRLETVKYLIEKGADFNAKDNDGVTILHVAAQEGHLDVVKYLIEKGAKIEAKSNLNKTPLELALEHGNLKVADFLRSTQHHTFIKGAASSATKPESFIGGLFSWVRGSIGELFGSRVALSGKPSTQNLLEESISGSRSKITTPESSWISEDISWLRGSMNGVVGSISNRILGVEKTTIIDEAKVIVGKVESTASEKKRAVEEETKLGFNISNSTSSTPYNNTDQAHNIGQKQGGKHACNYFTSEDFSRDNINYIDANLKRAYERQMPGAFKLDGKETTAETIFKMGKHYLSQVDNGTITFLDFLIRRITGQKHISTQVKDISEQEARTYAFEITQECKKIVEQAASKSGISIHRLDIDFMEIRKEITGKIMSDKFNEIPEILNSYVEKTLPSRKTGDPGRLSTKKFDKFMTEFNKRIDVALNQPIQQILNNRNSTLEVNDVKEQQVSLEPKSYLSNTSIQGHLTQDKAKLVF